MEKYGEVRMQRSGKMQGLVCFVNQYKNESYMNPYHLKIMFKVLFRVSMRFAKFLSIYLFHFQIVVMMADIATSQPSYSDLFSKTYMCVCFIVYLLLRACCIVLNSDL